MSKAKQTALFERVAFEAQLREHPGDRNAALAFTDWLTDAGYTVLGAKREVTRIVREATEQREYDKLLAWRNASIANRQRIEYLVRRRVRTAFNTVPMIHVVAGHRPPSFTIDPDWAISYATGHVLTPPLPEPLPFGFEIQHGNVDITVGASYLLKLIFPPSKSRDR